MVNINLTIIVELVLFLIFLWGANALAFRPLLKTMDNRSEKVAEDRQVAQKEKQQADELQAQYQRDLLESRRRLTDEYRKVHRAAQDKHMQALVQRRRELEEEMASVRSELQALVEQERLQYSRLVPELAESINASAVGGGRS